MLTLLQLLLAGTIEEAYPDVKIDEGVVQLTKDNFDTFLEKIDSPVIAEFYAPWCGFCKKLKPEYEKAAELLWEKEQVPLVKVDCTEEKEVCDKFGVQGFPTLKVFNKGKVGPTYEGARTSDGIVDYIVRRKMPAVTELKKASELSELKEKHGFLVISVSTSDDFKTAADSLRDSATFVSISEKLSKDVGKALETELKKNEIYLLTSFLDKPVSFGKFTDVEALGQWIKPRTLPVLGDVTPENFKQYSDSELPLGFIFFGTEEDKSTVTTALKEAANKQWGTVNFGFVDGKEHGDFAESLGLVKGEFPAMSIQNLKRQINFPYKGKWDKKEVSKFVESFANGDLKPHLKSEDIPSEEFDDKVRVVVGQNFEDVVLDKSKDVLIELYAPWCGFCKKLAPKWTQLAGALKKNKNLVIAKMDATTNDMPLSVEYTVKGFPTILFFKAKDNKMLEYSSSEREAMDFYKFVKENAATAIEVDEEDLQPQEVEEEEQVNEEEDVVEEEEDEQEEEEEKEEL